MSKIKLILISTITILFIIFYIVFPIYQLVPCGDKTAFIYNRLTGTIWFCLGPSGEFVELSTYVYEEPLLTIEQFKKKYPDYKDEPDQQLADRFYKKYYSHLNYNTYIYKVLKKPLRPLDPH